MMKRAIITFIILVTTISAVYAANYHGMGRSAYVYRNYDKAREYFLLDVKDNPNRGDSYYFLGEIEKNSRNYDESLNYFQTAVTKNMTRKYLINAYWNIIIFYEEKGDYKNLVKYCRELWSRTGDHSAKKKIESIVNKLLWTDNTLAIEKYNEGAALSKKGDKAGALRLYREALAIDGSFLAPRFELGISAYNSGNESEALNHLNAIGNKIPFYAEVHLILGGINFKNRNYGAAAENFTSVIEYGFIDKSTEYSTLIKRGTCYYNLNNYDQAEKDITASLDYIKNDSDPLLILSAIYIKKRNFESALKILAKAESVSGNNPVVIFQTGSIYYHQNNRKFVSYFDRLFDLTKSKDDDVRQYLKAFRILMNDHYNSKNYSRSLEISEVISRTQKDPDAILVAAVSSYNLQQYDRSIELFRKISLNSSSKVMLASAYSRTGDKQKAVEILNSSLNDTAFRAEAVKDPLLKSYINEIEKARADAAAKVKAEAEARAKAKAEADAKAKAEAEARAKAKAEADAKAKAEAEARAKAEAEADAKAKAEAEARAKAEADAKTKKDAEELRGKQNNTNESGNTNNQPLSKIN